MAGLRVFVSIYTMWSKQPPENCYSATALPPSPICECSYAAGGCLLFNMLFNFSCTPSLVLVLLCAMPYVLRLLIYFVVARFSTLFHSGEHLLNFTRTLLLNDCYQVAYIQLLRGGASNDYPGVFVVYVLIFRNHS
jgi:hypothetical protein